MNDRWRRLTRFATVGGAGLVVDLLVLQLAIAAGCGVLLGRLLSFALAATFTWQCNRHFTFRSSSAIPGARTWGRYMAAMLVGGALNYAVYSVIVLAMPGNALIRCLAVAMGALAGMGINYFNAQVFVFGATPPDGDVR